ncbi:DNA-binding protein D-ETS-4 isoform X1 [Tribolium castaneum]|uniref:DNA-binding protein D-ETS-4-like Protein n=2 Tax=Tribolium castaneum TaxID=7070 RepID=D2A0N6_TRICA|nr:PREDICTED: DNA-binding protein D-ETS-4 isoform X1 [Tribolium castaneum]EFA02538.2 DNA-binding protein D-ETS-4-like Protein [Tribolium castaneum]|eukprot:XP_968441.2 PREDICTED: DNA-binding protein D-ETS-4 isoform X1 [Tribolium castaneum]
MVLLRKTDMEDTMPQTVPSAGFTPPCDYTNFAENFDLSLLPGGEQVDYTQSPPPEKPQPKIYTTFYPNSPEADFRPDFQTLLVPDAEKTPAVFLEVPPILSPNSYRQSSEANFYPSSPELSLYTPSPNSLYSQSPVDDFFQYVKKEAYPPSPYSYRVKEENFLSPCGFSSPTSPATSYSSLSSPEQINTQQSENTDVLELLENTVLDKQIKQESTVDFGNLLSTFQDSESLRRLLEDDFKEAQPQTVPSKPKDHQLLREVLRDTSFQKKYNIKPIDFGFIGDIKMEEPDENAQRDLMREKIEPVLSLAIEQMRKDVDTTCAALGISPDPTQWSAADVLSWLQWTSRQFGLTEPVPDHWDMNGPSLAALSEEDFTRRAPQGGMILHAQLEIWKAAYSDEDLSMKWQPETTSSNASSGDMSDEDDDEASSSQTDPSRPTTSRSGGSHIHLWQFLKELLASPQTYGSCIRWLDRTKGIFKIEDSVKVARLWGKRKNRPAMNYDKLSRSIRQYYKKGIMKKTERSQRLVYQFCHPYNL